jgi:hypothetical protein
VVDLHVIVSGRQARLTARVDDTRTSSSNGIEPLQNIASAEYYVDEPPWSPSAQPHPMSPVDGTFDTPDETVQAILDIDPLDAGRHLVFVRGKDADDHWGVVSAVFLRKPAPASPAIPILLLD